MLTQSHDTNRRTSSAVVARLTSNTQSVIDEFVSGTRTARPLSFPLSSGKMRAMAVAEPVLVGARFTSPDLCQKQGYKGGSVRNGGRTCVDVFVEHGMLQLLSMQGRKMVHFPMAPPHCPSSCQ